MKKRIFKFGAALTAALMMFSATASLAFADEIVQDIDTSIEDVVEAPEVIDEDEDVDVNENDVIEVEVPLETEPITEGDAQLEAKVDDVATGSVINIGNVSSTKGDDYYNVNVPFTVSAGTDIPSQMSFFVYDITSFTGDQNNEVGFTTTTPVGYINQYGGTATGTYSFKLSTADYDDNSIIVVKIGGTGVSAPDAASHKLEKSTEWACGDVNHDKDVNPTDALLIMQYYAELIGDDALDTSLEVADTYRDGDINPSDALAIMQYYAEMIDSLPFTP